MLPTWGPSIGLQSSLQGKSVYRTLIIAYEPYEPPLILRVVFAEEHHHIEEPLTTEADYLCHPSSRSL